MPREDTGTTTRAKPHSVRQCRRRYLVQNGDTIWTIADDLSQLGVKPPHFDLIKYNPNIDPHFLKAGCILIVPTAPAGE